MLDHEGQLRNPPNRPEWFDKWKSLKNFTTVFAEQNISIIADGVANEVWEELNKLYPNLDLHRTSFGHNAGSFLYSLELALKLPSFASVYFVEDDYVHHEGSDLILEEGLTKSPYVSLYDHPDKYWGENANTPCKLIMTDSCHWRTTGSTTMTFASRVKNLQEDRDEFYRWCGGDDNWTHDTQLFTELSNKRGLVTPVPGYATHCDAYVVGAMIDWFNVLERTQ
jgi:hypothetical protein